MLSRSSFLARRLCVPSASSRFYTHVVLGKETDKIMSLTLSKAPVNSLNTELCTEISQAIKEVEAIKGVEGLIIKSDKRVFSAGLEITEMYNSSDEGLKAFWSSVQQLWLSLYGSRLATVAAIEGASPAGGCLIAISCDYRVMTDNPKAVIGLNETLLGLTAPDFFSKPFRKLVGPRYAEHFLQLGSLLTPQQALKHGLVDEVLPVEQVLPRSLEVVKQYANVLPDARYETKMRLRGEDYEYLKNHLQEDYDIFYKSAKLDSVQNAMGAYLESLKKKKK